MAISLGIYPIIRQTHIPLYHQSGCSPKPKSGKQRTSEMEPKGQQNEYFGTRTANLGMGQNQVPPKPCALT